MSDTLSFSDDKAGIYFRRPVEGGGFELILLEGDPNEVREAMARYLEAIDYGERPGDWVPEGFTVPPVLEE